jgi:hypothetical protein
VNSGAGVNVAAKVLVVALGSVTPRAAAPDDVRFLLDQGAEVTFVVTTLPADVRAQLDSRVHLIEVRSLEAGHPILRLEQFLIQAAPKATLAHAARITRALGRLAGAGRPAGRIGRRLARLERARARSAPVIQRRFRGTVYKSVRPWVLWRASRSALRPILADGPWRLVVVEDQMSIPTGWHLGRQLANTPVTLQLDRTITKPW